MKRWHLTLLAAAAALGLQACDQQPPRTTVTPPTASLPDSAPLNAASSTTAAAPAPAPAEAAPAPAVAPQAAASATATDPQAAASATGTPTITAGTQPTTSGDNPVPTTASAEPAAAADASSTVAAGPASTAPSPETSSMGAPAASSASTATTASTASTSATGVPDGTAAPTELARFFDGTGGGTKSGAAATPTKGSTKGATTASGNNAAATGATAASGTTGVVPAPTPGDAKPKAKPGEKVSADLPAVRNPGDPQGAQMLAQRALEVPVVGIAPRTLSDHYDQSRGSRRHEAIDILAPTGTPVVAVDDGRIAKLFTSKAGGLTIYQFDRNAQLAYYYAHLQRYADSVREGMEVKRGTLIGYVGATGNADDKAPHLHFAVFRLGSPPKWWQGEPVNPFPALARAQPADQVSVR